LAIASLAVGLAILVLGLCIGLGRLLVF